MGLRILRDYISELRFSRPDRDGRAIEYVIPKDKVYIEQPEVETLTFPSIVVRPGDGRYEPIGLVAYVDEPTRDLYGQGKVVQEQSEWTEVLTLECWAEQGPQRTSMMAGLEQALVPTEQLYGIRFRMPDYFDRTVCFSLWSGSKPDDPEAAKHRKWGLMQVEMRFNVCALVNYVEMRPRLEISEVDGDPIDPV